jgi:putative thioredoxin
MNEGVNFDVNDFEQEVLERSKEIPVLVDFWAEWCGPCKILGPILERLAARQSGNWELRKLDTERFPDVAARYGIRSIPNVKLFVDGVVAQEFVGALPEPMVEAWLAKAVPSKHQKDIVRAETVMRQGEREVARGILEAVIEEESDDEHVRALLALTIAVSDPERAVGLVVDIHEASPDGLTAQAVRTLGRLLEMRGNDARLPEGPARETYRLAIESLAQGDFDHALELFIAVLRDHRDYDDDGARMACLAIFAYLGEDHPVTRNRRREFSRALYA